MLLTIACLLSVSLSSSQMQSMHNIKKRFLIFPQAAPTRVQFIAGVGIPVDLEAETITTGAVLKAQFLLPYNATQLYYGLTAAGLPITRSTNERKRSIPNPRLVAYKALEHILDNRGYNGLDCILRAICEGARIPFSQSDPISELFHLFFTPSSSAGEMKEHFLNVYLNAEASGVIGDPCHLQYSRCNFSLIDVLTTVL